MNFLRSRFATLSDSRETLDSILRLPGRRVLGNTSKAIAILSYPRSGNHLVRGLLEATLRYPSIVGYDGNQADPPIFLWPDKLESPFIHKFHSVGHLLTQSEGYLSRVIVTTRPPADAISSHASREAIPTFRGLASMIRDRGLRSLRSEYAAWNDIQLFAKETTLPVLNLQFENLLPPEKLFESYQRICTFLDLEEDLRLSYTDVCNVADYTKRIQASAPNNFITSRYRHMVRSRLQNLELTSN